MTALANILAYEFRFNGVTGVQVLITTVTGSARRRTTLRGQNLPPEAAAAGATTITPTAAAAAGGGGGGGGGGVKASSTRLLTSGLLVQYTVKLPLFSTAPENIEGLLTVVRYIISSNAFLATLTTGMASGAPQLAAFTATATTILPTREVCMLDAHFVHVHVCARAGACACVRTILAHLLPSQQQNTASEFVHIKICHANYCTNCGTFGEAKKVCW